MSMNTRMGGGLRIDWIIFYMGHLMKDYGLSGSGKSSSATATKHSMVGPPARSTQRSALLFGVMRHHAVSAAQIQPRWCVWTAVCVWLLAFAFAFVFCIL
jgi:hypothetical protein